MTTEKVSKARLRAHLTTGGMIRTIRELQGMTQVELAKASGVDQPALSAIEHDRLELGVERAKRLGEALRVHPAILLFPDVEEGRTLSVTKQPKREALPRATVAKKRRPAKTRRTRIAASAR